MSKVKDYYGGMQVHSIKISQLLHKPNIKVIKEALEEAEFENKYDKKLVIDFIDQLKDNAETMDNIIRDYQEALKEQKRRNKHE